MIPQDHKFKQIIFGAALKEIISAEPIVQTIVFQRIYKNKLNNNSKLANNLKVQENKLSKIINSICHVPYYLKLLIYSHPFILQKLSNTTFLPKKLLLETAYYPYERSDGELLLKNIDSHK